MSAFPPTHPRPVNARPIQRPGQPTIVVLTLDDRSAATCQRCSICKAQRALGTNDRVECVNLVPESEIDDFIYGPIDAAMDTNSPLPSKSPTRGKKPDSRHVVREGHTRRRTIRQEMAEACDELISALAAERKHCINVDAMDEMTRPDNAAAAWAIEDAVIARTTAARKRVEAIMAKVHGEEIFGYSYDVSWEPVITEMNDGHMAIAIPALMCAALGGDARPMVIPISKRSATISRLR